MLFAVCRAHCDQKLVTIVTIYKWLIMGFRVSFTKEIVGAAICYMLVILGDIFSHAVKRLLVLSWTIGLNL